MNGETALLIFIKNAQKGQVKTRLAQTVGEEQALKIYLALLGHTRKVAQAVATNRLLFYSSYIDKTDDWPTSDFQKYVQEGTDLGARMLHAFDTAFEQHDRGVIIGSDCASLTPEIIQQAFDQLEYFPFVLGPATDGGYYLLGMRSPEATLFQNIAWSTDRVLATTIDRIKALGASYFLLPELSDIDFEEDWEQFGWEID